MNLLGEAKAALTPKVRKWIYGIATAGLVVMGVYGLVTAEQAAAWGLLAAAVTGLATANTDTASQSGMPDEA